MAGDTDFLALYHELGLRADCTPQALKLAYRKRVGELHPDRSPHDAATLGALQRVNVLYESAMAFHRRHGRLPGAPQAVSGAPDTLARSDPHRATPAAPAVARTSSRVLLATLAIAIVALWGWSGERDSSSAAPAAERGIADGSTPLAPAPAAARLIDLGSPAQQVRAIHGEPVSGSEQRWEYGPSWIVLRCGVVIDWYSSPLRPLKVAGTSPTASGNWSPPKNCKD